MGPELRELRAGLRRLRDPEIAAHSLRFFKTGPGEYGEGDRFLGIRVPVLRREARRCRALPLADLVRLLRSAYHEERLLALIALVERYRRGDERVRGEIYRLYLDNTDRINNWDLVDASAPGIVGAHLVARSRRPLAKLARSASLWERRIAILATLALIRNHEHEETLRIARILLEDREELIHKAVGWMLREVGKRDPRTARAFLRRHYRRMPRVMLRYAIERFPQAERKAYLEGAVR
jgi:3-methyladenine DNA glycosylase AlkD